MAERGQAGAIHPTALVSSGAEIGEGTTIGAFTIVESGTRIGPGSSIGPHCHLGAPSTVARGEPLTLGSGSLVRSHSVFYEGSRLGDRLVTGHRVTVRERTVAGVNLQIGTLSDLQGHSTIGDFVRLHSNVHIGQLATIEDFAWIFPYVVLTNDPTPPSEPLVGCRVGAYSAIATMSVVLPGVSIGRDALVGAMTLVRSDVGDRAVCIGNPGASVGDTSRVRLRGSGRPAYPWRRHFHRGYPAHVVEGWRREFPEG